MSQQKLLTLPDSALIGLRQSTIYYTLLFQFQEIGPYNRRRRRIRRVVQKYRKEMFAFCYLKTEVKEPIIANLLAKVGMQSQ